jgi:hypothetical protein
MQRNALEFIGSPQTHFLMGWTADSASSFASYAARVLGAARENFGGFFQFLM